MHGIFFMMTREQLLKAIRKGKLADIDWETFRLPRKISKFRLGCPEVSLTLTRVFNHLYEEGILSEDTLPYPTMARLYKEVRDLGLPKSFILKKHPKIGYGVFTQDKMVKPKTILGIYTGKLILIRVDSEEENESLYVYGIEEEVSLTRHQYNRLMKEGFIPKSRKKFDPEEKFEITLDAEKEGNWTRFINHSDRPNCAVELRKIHVCEDGYIVLPMIISKRKIMPHTQVTTSYGSDYWKASKIKKRKIHEADFVDV